MKGIVLLSLLALIGAGVAQAPGENSGQYSVYLENGKHKLVKGKADNYVAVAFVETNPNITGWATLDLTTNAKFDDLTQAYAGGYLEGALTTNLIMNQWRSKLEDVEFYNGSYPTKAGDWFAENDKWVRQQVKNCEGVNSEECDYWFQVGLVLRQLDGIVLGYNDFCAADKKLPYEVFLYLATDADFWDVMSAIDYEAFAPKTAKQYMEREHCSVLIKRTDTELFHSHVTWAHYINMLRVFKHYTFNYNHKSTASKTVSFSSFPGFIPSGDDYFITDQGLIVTETSTSMYNASLFQNVKTNTVMYWIRTVVANRMASNGSEWARIFAKYNSGTYNNQWHITDTKLYYPGQTVLPNGTLTMLEQIPGYTETADVTWILNQQGYFVSYNVPFLENIVNMAGWPEMKAKYGDAYSHDHNVRANIFRRDQGNVRTMDDMKYIMRYNKYQTDPLSLGDSCNGISSRCDLNTTTFDPYGGFDCKVTSATLIKTMTTEAVSGPSTVDQPAFTWDVLPFSKMPHYGQPNVYNFSFQTMKAQPQTPNPPADQSSMSSFTTPLQFVLALVVLFAVMA